MVTSKGQTELCRARSEIARIFFKKIFRRDVIADFDESITVPSQSGLGDFSHSDHFSPRHQEAENFPQVLVSNRVTIQQMVNIVEFVEKAQKICHLSARNCHYSVEACRIPGPVSGIRHASPI